jgi:hypothetical protein
MAEEDAIADVVSVVVFPALRRRAISQRMRRRWRRRSARPRIGS